METISLATHGTRTARIGRHEVNANKPPTLDDTPARRLTFDKVAAMSFGFDPMSLGISGILCWFLYYVMTSVIPTHRRDMRDLVEKVDKIVDKFDEALKRQQKLCEDSRKSCDSCSNYIGMGGMNGSVTSTRQGG